MKNAQVCKNIVNNQLDFSLSLILDMILKACTLPHPYQ